VPDASSRQSGPAWPPETWSRSHGIQALDDLLGATYSRDRQAMQLLSAFAAVTVPLSLRIHTAEVLRAG